MASGIPGSRSLLLVSSIISLSLRICGIGHLHEEPGINSTGTEEDEQNGDEERFEDRDNMRRCALWLLFLIVRTLDSGPNLAI